MKRLLAWILRIACFAIIIAAVYTLVGCLLHINDDHSAQAIMGTTEITTFESGDLTALEQPTPQIEVEKVDENPSVIVYSDGDITLNRPYATATAAFSDIVNSIVADLKWYVDGELVKEEAERLLVEGSTVNCKVELDLEKTSQETAQVVLEVYFDDKSIVGITEVLVEAGNAEESGVVIRTEEIPVTAKRATPVYTDHTLEEEIDEMERNEVGLFLAYESDNNGMAAIQLLFEDGSMGWVDSDDVDITDENCTTDEDYTEEQKVDFVNSMKYDSQTSYMIWVSLYTQKVNVFYGYQGNWEFSDTFDCSTGANDCPTTTGTFQYYTLKDRWDLGKTYVEPVMIFNGGEAFTSRPYDVDTDKIADETMGEPGSGGAVRMMEEDIAWLANNIPIGTLVVVY